MAALAGARGDPGARRGRAGLRRRRRRRRSGTATVDGHHPPRRPLVPGTVPLPPETGPDRGHAAARHQPRHRAAAGHRHPARHRDRLRHRHRPRHARPRPRGADRPRRRPPPRRRRRPPARRPPRAAPRTGPPGTHRVDGDPVVGAQRVRRPRRQAQPRSTRASRRACCPRRTSPTCGPATGWCSRGRTPTGTPPIAQAASLEREFPGAYARRHRGLMARRRAASCWSRARRAASARRPPAAPPRPVTGWCWRRARPTGSPRWPRELGGPERALAVPCDVTEWEDQVQALAAAAVEASAASTWRSRTPDSARSAGSRTRARSTGARWC